MVSASRRGFPRLSRVLPTSRVFTSGYVNTETILHFFSIFHTNIEYVNKRLEKFFCSISACNTYGK